MEEIKAHQEYYNTDAWDREEEGNLVVLLTWAYGSLGRIVNSRTGLVRVV